MTEFGENLFILLIAAAIGLIIQYHIIKAAVLSALRKHDASSQNINRMMKLMEITAKGVGKNEDMESFIVEKRKKEYANNRQSIIENYSPHDRKQKLAELDEEYKDVLDLK